MTPARCCPALAVLLLAASFGAAQESPPVPSQTLSRDVLDPDALPRVAESLKVLRTADPDGTLLHNLIRDIRRNAGRMPPQEFAAELARKYPSLAPSDMQGAFRDIFDKLRTDSAPPGDRRPRDFPRFPPIPPSPEQPAPPVKSPEVREPPLTPDPPEPRPPAVPAFPQQVPEPSPLPPPPDLIPPGDGPPGFDSPPPGIEFEPEMVPGFGPGFEPVLPNDEQLRRARQLETAMKFWEQNVGRLDDTPAVKNLLAEMFTGSAAIDRRSGDKLASILAGGDATGDRWLPDAAREGGAWEPPPFDLDLQLGDWKFPDLGLGKLGGTWSAPTTGGGWNTGSWTGRTLSAGSFGNSWLPVVVFVVVLVGALVLWRFWPELTGQASFGPQPLPGLGPWPVDPRTIADRDGLVRAFEYLSVLACGAGAVVWNHVAIAAALRSHGGPAADAAEPLSRLYAVARYTPADEPLPPDALAEARHHLCRLAGVAAP